MLRYWTGKDALRPLEPDPSIEVDNRRYSTPAHNRSMSSIQTRFTGFRDKNKEAKAKREAELKALKAHAGRSGPSGESSRHTGEDSIITANQERTQDHHADSEVSLRGRSLAFGDLDEFEDLLLINDCEDRIDNRGEGQVTKMGAGESYRPNARPRSPPRADTFRSSDRDRSPRRRSPPVSDSYHPGDRRRSRSPGYRRERTPPSSWRGRPRSPPRARSPRRFSPRRDDDRRERARSPRRDDKYAWDGDCLCVNTNKNL